MKKIVIISDSFKGCLSSTEVEKSIAEGIHCILPTCQTVCIPIADGGEGLLEVMVKLTKGKIIHTVTHDPLMRPITASYGLLGDNETVIIEMAQASGLPLLQPEERNPLITSSFGTGELILDAIKKGYRKFLIGIGGSATNDAGTGMMQALNTRFLDQEGKILPTGCGGILKDIRTIDLSDFNSLINTCSFTIACDVNNPLYGPNGAAAIFAPQKGASHEDVAFLDKGLSLFSECIQAATGKDISLTPGAGAAGGIGGAFAAFFNARLVPGIEMVLEVSHFNEEIKNADLIITGEGRADSQTLMGKVPAGVLKQAQQIGIPVILLAGSVGATDDLNNAGFSAVLSITQGPTCLKDAMKPEIAKRNLKDTTAQVVRLTHIFDKMKGL